MEPDLLGQSHALMFMAEFRHVERVRSALFQFLETVLEHFPQKRKNLVGFVVNLCHRRQSFVEASFTDLAEALDWFLDPRNFSHSSLVRNAISEAIAYVVHSQKNGSDLRWLRQLATRIEPTAFIELANIDPGDAAIAAMLTFEFSYLEMRTIDSWTDALDSVFDTLESTRGSVRTRLALACCLDLPNTAAYCLAQKPKQLNRQEFSGETPLMITALVGSVKAAKVLASQSLCDVNHKARFRETALMMAANGNRADIVEIILEHQSCDPNIRMATGDTALHIACSNGYSDVARSLIKRGADVNVPNNVGHSPLMSACHAGHTAIVEMLLQYKATDLNMHCKDEGSTALMLACVEGHVEIVRCLLASGRVNVEAENYERLTALDVAHFSDGDRESLISMLEEAGAR